jgi:serine/threonine protein kinase
MTIALTSDEDLMRRLPLPLAQLYRRAHNRTGPERHHAAFYLWEAALKLLGSVAVVGYAERGSPDPVLAERLENLARPALGHWWEFVRLLVPALAESDAGFAAVREMLLGRARDDLPRTAGLDAALREALEGHSGARATVRLTDLFDRLVRYRNREVGHGAVGQRPAAFYDRMGDALLAGAAELLGRLDVLAGRRLLAVAAVRREPGGGWEAECYELAGETARRTDPLRLPEAEVARLPRPEHLYLAAALPAAGGPAPALHSLHPLAVHDAETGEVYFLNARRGRRRTEYLCYATGQSAERQDLDGERRALLAHVLGMPVADGQVEQWESRSQADDPSAEPSAAPGARQLGEFELLSTLGQGGMGVVYRAWQPSLGRQVALKCLHHAGSPKAEARFAREIRALGRVRHPHLVTIYTSASAGKDWFYAMELVEGATLGAVCDRLSRGPAGTGAPDLRTWHEAVSTVCGEARQAEEPLADPEALPGALRRPPAEPGPPPELPAGGSYVRRAAELVRQVAEAAHALHEAGVIHRDIKPGNVLVTPDGNRAMLMDLGLAQLADDIEGKITRTRQFVGTLRYASPEQVRALAKVNRCSDVYSLGATLWELLALRPLFGATDETPTPELMERIQDEEPGPVRRHQPGVPRDLDVIAAKCLEKKPAKRYATAKELADDLGRFLAGEPIRARPLTLRERAGRRAWRYRQALAMLAVALTAAFLGFGLQSLARYRAPEPPVPPPVAPDTAGPTNPFPPAPIPPDGGQPVSVPESGSAAPPAVPAPELTRKAYAIFTTYCFRCHGGGERPDDALFNIFNRDEVLHRQRIVLGSAVDSRVFRRVESEGSDKMPPEGETPRPTAVEKELLKRWIDAGAPELPPPDRPPDVQKLPFRGPRPGKAGERYALLIGVDRFDDADLRPLKYPQKDMADLAHVLVQGGYRSDAVVLMTSSAGEKDPRRLPTEANIRTELRRLAEVAGPDDSLLVALTGLSAQFRGDAESYFCPAGARLKDRTTLISIRDIYKELDRSRSRSKVVLFDATGADATGRPRSPSDLESVTRPQAVTPPSETAVVFSCAAGQPAYASDDLGHGVFFHFVIEGLRGKASAAGGEAITLEDLTDYTKREVTRFTRSSLSADQVPTRVGQNSSSPIILDPPQLAKPPKEP